MLSRALDILDIEKSYQDFKAVKGVSFHVRPGEIVSLLGCNGAGKTTTLNIITGFSKPDAGKVLINGKEVKENLEFSRNQFGFLTAEMALYQRLSVKESIEFLADFRNVSETVKQNQMKKFWEMFDLSEIESKKFHDLSSGQKQKALISAALIHDPNILIFDEITASIDILTSKVIMDFIKEERERGKAVLFSTHILSEAEYLSDRIVILNEGELIQETTSEDMKKQFNTHSLYEAFFDCVEQSKKAA